MKKRTISRWPCGLSLWILLIAGAPERAQAFSEEELFEQEAAARGGGGGRYFTGSPVDGFGCDVCHQGGQEPRLEVRGLPLDGYVPGTPYEVTVSWWQPETQSPDVPPPAPEMQPSTTQPPVVRHALHLEVVGRDGLAAGQLQLVDEDQLEAEGRCAALEKRLEEGRQILRVEECDASSVRFFFSPPDADAVAFAVSIVASDGGGSPQGDGAFTATRVLNRGGDSTGGCSAAASRGPDQRLDLPWLALSVLVGLRYYLRRRGSRSFSES